MKSLVILLTLMFSTLSFSGEITGIGRQALQVLEGHQMDLSTLRQRGLKVHLGEITGVGKKINLESVEMVVTKKKIFTMRELSHIEYRHPSAAKTLDDVVHFEFDRNILKKHQIAGVVYK